MDDTELYRQKPHTSTMKSKQEELYLNLLGIKFC